MMIGERYIKVLLVLIEIYYYYEVYILILYWVLNWLKNFLLEKMKILFGHRLNNKIGVN